MDINERVDKAKALFAEGHNCSQAVFMAYSDIYGLDDNLAGMIASPLGGGVGRMREVCGAVTGMALALGMKHKEASPLDKPVRMATYKEVQEAGRRFEQKFGSVVCRDLLNLRKGEEVQLSPSGHPVDKPGAISCAKIVEEAARIVGEMLSAN